MLLKLDEYHAYVAHFHREAVPNKRRKGPEMIWETVCRVHDANDLCYRSNGDDRPGPCRTASLLGVTRWNPLDRHTKSMGRKHALARAIEGLDFVTRSRIWEAYWAIVPKPSSNGNGHRS